MLFSHDSAIREIQRLGEGYSLRKKWYGWIIIDSPLPPKKTDNSSVISELIRINNKLDRLCGCIEENDRYGGAIKTTTAKRY